MGNGCRRWFARAALLAAALVAALPAAARAVGLEDVTEQRWARLREAERYQMKIADEYWRQANWKAALTEYEKFLSLYEESELASFAQLRWSLCQVRLRKLNTAIKDGFQSVIDYWPESTDAVSAAYFIGRTYKDMGETKPAKKAYAALIQKHEPGHLACVLARLDLIELARVEQDAPRQVALWKELVHDTPRDADTRAPCEAASRDFAAHSFANGAFADGIASLETTYQGDALVYNLVEYARGPLQNLASQDETKPTGYQVADAAVAWLRERLPSDTTDEAAKTTGRTVLFAVADIETFVRRVDRVPAVFQQALDLYGTEDVTLGRYGNWFRGQGRWDEARATFSRFQDHIQGLSNVALAFRDEAESTPNKERYNDAVRTYQTLAAEDADHQFDWLGQAAWTYRRAGKPDEAVAVYGQLVSADAERANAWQFEIGNTLRDFARYRDAIAAYQQCDNFPDPYWQMAGCYRALTEYNEAISLYQQIYAAYEPWQPQALLQIGYTYEQAAEQEKAIKTFQAVCKKFPKAGEASEAHNRLNDQYGIRVTLGGDAGEE
jgi:tetratricopeptide (TPR) repeat protein